MCRTLVEIKYVLCFHQDIWEIASSDADCNGILHSLSLDSTRKCKHCWVTKEGQRKKTWKVAGVDAGVDKFQREWDHHLNFNKIVYPMQKVDARPTSNCPTWQRRWPWQTRMWAVRQLNLQRMSRYMERHVWELEGRPDFVQTSWTIDQDTKGDGDNQGDAGELLAVVPLEDLEPEDRECAICRAPFVDEGDGDVCSGGGQVARRLPCLGQHIFGIECIVKAWKYTLVASGRPECPTCRHPLNVMVLSPMPFRTRLEEMLDFYRKKFLAGQRYALDDPRRDPKAISTWQYVMYCTSIIAAIPMFNAVNHSMNIWNSKHGKLPHAQIAVVVVTGAVLQSFWLLALLLVFPPFVMFYRVSGPRVQREPRPEQSVNPHAQA